MYTAEFVWRLVQVEGEGVECLDLLSLRDGTGCLVLYCLLGSVVLLMLLHVF
jgi:hypothetical protein